MELSFMKFIRNAAKNRLKDLLLDIKDNNTSYYNRYELIFHAFVEAIDAGFKTGIKIDHNNSEYFVVCIELPTGQISWQIPQHEFKWDDCSEEEMCKRIYEFVGEDFIEDRIERRLMDEEMREDCAGN